jgi:RNA polymerase sigma-70 factor (ECF subfamily)
VFSLLYRMVRDRALAEDLAQETFIKVLNGIKSYRPEFKFSSWIFKIANNAAIEQLGDRAESPLDEVESRELGTAIERAIARLRPEYRSCILLRHVEGYSYEEIADTLELPLGTVKTYIHRARNELRGFLADRRD